MLSSIGVWSSDQLRQYEETTNHKLKQLCLWCEAASSVPLLKLSVIKLENIAQIKCLYARFP